VAVLLLPQRVLIVFFAHWAFSYFGRNIYTGSKYKKRDFVLIYECKYFHDLVWLVSRAASTLLVVLASFLDRGSKSKFVYCLDYWNSIQMKEIAELCQRIIIFGDLDKRRNFFTLALDFEVLWAM
jgi:hypothetical protein